MSSDRDRTTNRRSRGREIALQVLYQVEQNPELDRAEIDRFVARRVREPWLRERALELARRGRLDLAKSDALAMIEKALAEVRAEGSTKAVFEGEFAHAVRDLAKALDLRDFTRALHEGVIAHKEVIDKAIEEVAENWSLDRMAAIDRNILRVGAYEILFAADVPNRVAINEALEIAKRYSTAQSSRFVNGILDRLREKLENPAPPPPAAPEIQSIEPGLEDESQQTRDPSLTDQSQDA